MVINKILKSLYYLIKKLQMLKIKIFLKQCKNQASFCNDIDYSSFDLKHLIDQLLCIQKPAPKMTAK